MKCRLLLLIVLIELTSSIVLSPSFVPRMFQNIARAEVFLNADASGFHTSDRFDVTAMNIVGDTLRADPIWPYKRESNDAIGLSFSAGQESVKTDAYELNAYQIWVGEIVRPHSWQQWRYRIGYSYAETEGASVASKTRGDMFWELQFVSASGETFWYSLGVQRRGLWSQVLTADGDSRVVVGEEFQPQAVWRWAEKWRLRGRGQYTILGDDNVRAQSDAEVSYGINTGDPWVWLGVGANYWTFRRNAVDYYSPSYVASWGPRLELAKQLGEWTISLGGSFSRYRESGSEEQNSHYLLGSIQYGSREARNLKLFYENVHSERYGRKWWQDGGGLAVVWPF